jgi:hypothetical protein
MVRIRYIPPQDPRQEVEKLRSALAALEGWRGCYSPASPQYWALNDAKAALNKVAELMWGTPLTSPHPTYPSSGGSYPPPGSAGG